MSVEKLRSKATSYIIRVYTLVFEGVAHNRLRDTH